MPPPAHQPTRRLTVGLSTPAGRGGCGPPPSLLSCSQVLLSWDWSSGLQAEQAEGHHPRTSAKPRSGDQPWKSRHRPARSSVHIFVLIHRGRDDRNAALSYQKGTEAAQAPVAVGDEPGAATFDRWPPGPTGGRPDRIGGGLTARRGPLSRGGRRARPLPRLQGAQSDHSRQVVHRSTKGVVVATKVVVALSAGSAERDGAADRAGRLSAGGVDEGGSRPGGSRRGRHGGPGRPRRTPGALLRHFGTSATPARRWCGDSRRRPRSI